MEWALSKPMALSAHAVSYGHSSVGLRVLDFTTRSNEEMEETYWSCNQGRQIHHNTNSSCHRYRYHDRYIDHDSDTWHLQGLKEDKVLIGAEESSATLLAVKFGDETADRIMV
jgi:hypothetical protein